MRCCTWLLAGLLLLQFSTSVFGGGPRYMPAPAEAMATDAPCDSACSSCDRCFLGSLIARFDATYEDALARRRCKRPLCNRSVMERLTWCPAEGDCACGGAPNMALNNNGYMPARYASQGAPMISRSAPPQAVASRAVPQQAAPTAGDFAPEPGDEQEPAPTKAEPVKLITPRGDSGAQLRRAATSGLAEQHVEQAAFAATDEELAAPLTAALAGARTAVLASFSEEHAATAAPSATRLAKPVETRPAAIEIRFKGELDDERPAEVNPLR